VADDDSRMQFSKPPAKPGNLPPGYSALWDEFAAGLEFPSDDPRYVEARNALDMIVEETRPAEPDFWGEPVMRSFPVGQQAVEHDALGHTRIAPDSASAEEMAAHAKAEERFASETQEVHEGFREVDALRKLAAEIADPAVAEIYRSKADALQEQLVERRSFLRQERTRHYEALGLDHDQAVGMLESDRLGFRLGETSPPADSLAQVINAAKAGQTDQVLAALSEMDSKGRYEAMNQLGDQVSERFLEQLTDRLEVLHMNAPGG
jgi:hypothetical protein